MPISNLSSVDKLMDIGLKRYEALAYLTLLEKNNAAAIDIANRSGIPRQRIYDILDTLQTKGLCIARQERPRRYIAHRPQQALAAVLNYQKQQQAAKNERQARLIEALIPSLNMILNEKNGGEAPSPAHINDNAEDYHNVGGL